MLLLSQYLLQNLPRFLKYGIQHLLKSTSNFEESRQRAYFVGGAGKVRRVVILGLLPLQIRCHVLK